MDFWSLIPVFFVVAVIILSIRKKVNLSQRKDSMINELNCLANFTPTQKFIGNDGEVGIAFDENRREICLINFNFECKNNCEFKFIDYKDVLSSNLFVDGDVITKTDRSSQVGAALLGGLAFGGVGAIIGGLSGKTKSSDLVRRIDLRLIVNDIKRPLYDINFMNFEANKNSTAYKTAMDQARHWHGLLTILMKEADSNDTEDKNVNSVKSSIADELLKLSQLKDKGLLTELEFYTQKQKLLS